MAKVRENSDREVRRQEARDVRGFWQDVRRAARSAAPAPAGVPELPSRSWTELQVVNKGTRAELTGADRTAALRAWRQGTLPRSISVAFSSLPKGGIGVRVDWTGFADDGPG